MKQVDAGGAKNIVGVTPRHQANCLTKQRALAFRGFGFLIWKIIPNVFRTMKYISTTHYARGPTWGVLPNHRVVCSRASNAKTCTFTPFKYVRGSLVMVEVSSEGVVVGVNKQGKVLQRIGITYRNPHGTGWKVIPMCMAIRHVSYDLGFLWAVSNSGLIFKCAV
ncbi:Fish-egg lectin [Trichinella sp. T6]|nr:Fish-egg lectin [Trichinella sp. T6]